MNTTEMNSPSDVKETLILVDKLKKNWSKNWHRIGSNDFVKKQVPKHPTSHQNSSLLAKELWSVLDVQVDALTSLECGEIVDECSSSVSAEQSENTSMDQHQLFLVRGIAYPKCHKGNENCDKIMQKRKRPVRAIDEKYHYYQYCDEAKIASNCRSIALTPDWILNHRDVYPWPHPKNVRYLEEFCVKKHGKNGCQMLVKASELQPQPKSSKSLVISSDLNNHNAIRTAVKITEKKRKQNRKRGKKKGGVKFKNSNINCQTARNNNLISLMKK